MTFSILRFRAFALDSHNPSRASWIIKPGCIFYPRGGEGVDRCSITRLSPPSRRRVHAAGCVDPVTPNRGCQGKSISRANCFDCGCLPAPETRPMCFVSRMRIHTYIHTRVYIYIPPCFHVARPRTLAPLFPALCLRPAQPAAQTQTRPCNPRVCTYGNENSKFYGRLKYS